MASERELPDAEVSMGIPLAEIDQGDERFRISTCRESDDLKRSIGRMGLLIHPLVVPAATGFIIVSGFRRIGACADLGWTRVPARILRTNSPAYECALRAVGENSLTRPLNLIEASCALDLLERMAPDGRIAYEDAAALGLPCHAGMISQLKRLCHLPAAIQDAVLDSAVSFAMACELGRMEAGLGSAFARLFLRLKPSLSKQREIVALVSEIAAREGVDPRQVLLDACPPDGAGRQDEDPNQQTQRLRRRLRARRFPALTAAEENFQRLRQRLELGAAIQLTPPRDFEGTRFALTLNFQTLEDVARLRDSLDRVIGHPDFRTLLTGKARGFEEDPGT